MSKIGRNDTCPCGSGKKYKRCCITSMPTAGVDDSHGRPRDDGLRPARYGFAQQMADFAEPLLGGGDGSLEQTQKAMNLGMVFWNLAVLPDEDRHEALEKMTATMSGDADEFRTIAGQTVERHRRMFPEHHDRGAGRGT